MIENVIHFATANPWTTALTALSLFLFIAILFLINGKNGIPTDAKLNTGGLNFFMVFMIILVVGCIGIIATTPSFATLIDKGNNAALIYWVGVACLWGCVKYVTAIDPEEVFNEITN